MNRPQDASDSKISELFEMAAEITRKHAEALKADPGLGERLDRVSVPELFFSTTKRHLPDIFECRDCGYQFPAEAACPECNSANHAVFVRAPSRSEVRHHTADRESELTDLDPDWRSRFPSIEAAEIFYGFKPSGY